MALHSRRVVAVAMLVVSLVGCPSGRKPSPRASGSATPSPAKSGPSGGTLIVAYPHEPSTLNPYVRGGDAPATRDLVRPFLPSLYRLAPDGARALSLLSAEPAVELGPPFRVLLTLRDDARWSDGKPVTANDLRFTWRSLVNARNPVVSRDGYDQISDVVVVSPGQARLVFSKPFARWQDLFTWILPEHRLRGAAFAKALATGIGVSGGAFTFRSWTPGLEIVYDRNPRAWGEVPRLEHIIVRFVPDVVTALQLLRRNEVDALGPYDGLDLRRRAGLVGGTATTDDHGATWAGLWLNTRSPLLSDARVRRALAYALDRRAVLDGLVRDGGVRADSLTPADKAAPFSAFAHDLARARTLLDQAGWRGSGTRTRGGRELSVTVATIGSDELTTRVLRALHAQAEGAGIDLNVVDLDPVRLWRDWLWSSRFEAAFVTVRDPALGALRARFESTRVRPAGGNVFGLSDAALDGLLRASDAAIPPNPDAARQAEQRLAGDVPAIPLYQVAIVLTAGPRAGGLQANASQDGFLWNAAEWFRKAA